MNPDSKITSNKRHVGHNLRMICLYMGIKQSALATDLGLSQAEISRIERQEHIKESFLIKVSAVLGIPAEVIKDFDAEKIIDNINNSKEGIIFAKTSCACDASQQINPLDKIVELYNRLLRSEREKIELLKNK